MTGSTTTTTTNITTNSQNILPKLQTLPFLYPFLFLILILIVSMFMIFFKADIPFKSQSKSQQELAANIFGSLTFVLLIFGLSVLFLPNFKELRELFQQISSVTYVIFYTLFIMLFFSLMPKDIIDKYSYIITPVALGIGALAFYKGISSDYVSEFNVNYERIKALILLFCLITGSIVYYNSDPGGYIKKYFGYSLLLTIILSVFAFLYLIVLFTLPEGGKNLNSGTNMPSFLQNFSKFGVYNAIAFIVFLITMTVLISTYKGGFFNDKITSFPVMVLLLLICISWSLVIGTNLFPEISTGFGSDTNKMNIFKRSLLALFGVIISGLIIFWLVYNLQHFSGKTGLTSFILNLLIIVMVLGLIYKTINVRLPAGNTKKNAFFNIIFSTLFYIPCLFSDTFDAIGKLVAGDYDATTAGSLLMIGACVVLLFIYFKSPSLFNSINLQGGQQIVDNPVPMDTQHSLGTYETLNGGPNFDYHYAISCWVYIDSAPPSTNSSYNKYTSLLNFGDKPNILYNAQAHTLMIKTQQKDLKKTTTKDSPSKLIDFDENGDRIIYMNKDFLLQKWNNIIINYNGGVLDIFLNGELVKSDVGVVPYYTLDNLTIGENNGIKGGICNVIYFRNALTAPNIYYLYNMVKNTNPPVIVGNQGHQKL